VRPDSPEVAALGEELARAEAEDPAFSAELRERWRTASVEQHGGVNNQVSGTVSGKVLQARDISGDISF
jgi:hypothetical protein